MAFCVLAWAGSQGGAGRGVGAGMRAGRGGGHGGSWAIKEHLKQQLPAPGTPNAGVRGACVTLTGTHYLVLTLLELTNGRITKDEEELDENNRVINKTMKEDGGGRVLSGTWGERVDVTFRCEHSTSS